MPTMYKKADVNVSTALYQVMGLYHKGLQEAQVKVGVIFAYNDKGSAVKKDGYPKAATISLVSAKDKVMKPYEAELLIDEEKWRNSTTEQQVALLDHELSHLELIPEDDEDSEVPYKTDDEGRPKLRIQLGDFNAGDGFKDVVTRHGEDSPELQALRQCLKLANEVS